MLRHVAAVGTVALMVSAFTPSAHASDGPSGSAECGNSQILVTVCASDPESTQGSGGNHGDDSKSGASSANSGSGSKEKCTYTKLDPQPPADNEAVKEGKKQGGEGAVYQVLCPETGRIGVVWIPDGQDQPAEPQIDPEVVARQAVDSMKLVGPKVANPRAGGEYVVGMPTWMWVDQSATTYGPNTATATAGGVTVTATAKVSSIRWDMGDGTPAVVCTGPGTKYEASMGKAKSPDCGHIYAKPSDDEKNAKFHGTATATWTVDWTVTGGPADAGQFTEVRQSPFTVDVREVQVLN